jgi:hypothetical protein
VAGVEGEVMPFKCERGRDVPYLGGDKVSPCECGVIFMPAGRDLEATLRAIKSAGRPVLGVIDTDATAVANIKANLARGWA